MKNIKYILVVLFVIYAVSYHAKMILIGKGIIKDKRYSESEVLKRLFYRGILFLSLDFLLLVSFIWVIVKIN